MVPAGRRMGSCTPVGGAFRRRGGSGGKRRPHAWQVASSSAFSAVQNGQNLTYFAPLRVYRITPSTIV